MAVAEAYLHAKFHLDPFNCLATIHQRYRELDRQIDMTDRQGHYCGTTSYPIALGRTKAKAKRFTNGRPKMFPKLNDSRIPSVDRDFVGDIKSL